MKKILVSLIILLIGITWFIKDYEIIEKGTKHLVSGIYVYEKYDAYLILRKDGSVSFVVVTKDPRTKRDGKYEIKGDGLEILFSEGKTANLRIDRDFLITPSGKKWEKM